MSRAASSQARAPASRVCSARVVLTRTDSSHDAWIEDVLPHYTHSKTVNLIQNRSLHIQLAVFTLHCSRDTQDVVAFLSHERWLVGPTHTGHYTVLSCKCSNENVSMRLNIPHPERPIHLDCHVYALPSTLSEFSTRCR